ncbi:MAG: beta-ketoacyl-[acyl-carrier-protein] synthase family protein [Sulfurimonas sp.]|nr:beta-ketoacyl-[acyl-carrier-protein] synthase family protein [Sulfurimonas sp.]
MRKAYINATSIRSICGNTKQTLDAVFNKKSSLTILSDVVPDKTICIGKFPDESSFEELLFDSVDEILNESNLQDYSNTLLLVGSSVGGMATTEKILFRDDSYKNINVDSHTINVIAYTLNKKYNFLATRSFSTACTSSANALKVAKELINVGAYDNVLVVGADETCSTTIFGFSALGILSDEVCRPFQNGRKGMNVSEGIGTLLLQNSSQDDSVELVGVGASSDAYHIANPDPTATGAKTSIGKALANASLNPQDIDYINAHGTGTMANDTTEAKAILNIFGDQVHVSSSKSNIGHTLGAAGAIEAVICVQSLKKQLLPPQIYCADNENSLNYVDIAKNAKIGYVLSNSFAFGGNNTSLIFGACLEN